MTKPAAKPTANRSLLLLPILLLVAVGAWREWAGFVYPGLVALALVTLPVLVQFAQDLPGWVPLTLVGLALLALGARLEAARRRGGQLRHWVAHLH